MTVLRPIDFAFLDELVETGRGPGYVLDFSDRSFAQFFADEVNVDIDDPVYAQGGTSKGKRLRYFLQKSDAPTAVRTLRALWDYRVAIFERTGQEDKVRNAHGRLLTLIDRLQGKSPEATQPPTINRPAFNWQTVAALRDELTGLSTFAPQPRGYAFEAFLHKLFTAFDMKPREPFRNRGEQIDGSFDLGNETYLLEAKWHNELTSAADLHILQGKLDGKAAWARGLFVSYTGYSEDGIYAFNRGGKRVICADGRDIYESLERQIPWNHVLERKIRRAAETGNVLARVSDLF